MKINNLTILAVLLFLSVNCAAQNNAKTFTHADTLRGTITPERAWWNVLRYDVTLKPDYNSKTIAGKNLITYMVVKDNSIRKMQIDLKEPLLIDSIILNGKSKLNYTRDGNAWFAKMPAQKKGSTNKVEVFYHGLVHEAKRAPWDGGFSFVKDSLNRPMMTVTCQGDVGASIWYPCKDHQSDEPDNGASLTMIVPDTLVAVSNGRMEYMKKNNDGTATYKWAVVNPISNYCLIPYIGKYVNFKDSYMGEKGKLDINYWVLDYNLPKAKAYFPKEVHNMLKAHEYWMGPYPFYEDGFKLVDVLYPGMEHQSAVSYGNNYKGGYGGRDQSGTGNGMKWDFIIVHEAGHEWFGNNITSKDLADMWVHEGFTNYSETMYVDYIYGTADANAYNQGIRRGIRNDKPIIPAFNVNAQGSGDMYPKTANMIHAIRHSIDNDVLFRNIIRGLNKTFYHQTVTGMQVQDYISSKAGFDFAKVFDQYLRTVQIPQFEFYFSADKKQVSYRYTNSIDGFNLPLVLKNGANRIKILPTTAWNTTSLTNNQIDLFTKVGIEKMYYLKVVEAEKR